MSETMKRAHELAPFVAEALRAVADEADYPDGIDSREWTVTDNREHQYAVTIAEVILKRDTILLDDLLAHAEAARDAALEEYNV